MAKELDLSLPGYNMDHQTSSSNGIPEAGTTVTGLQSSGCAGVWNNQLCCQSQLHQGGPLLHGAHQTYDGKKMLPVLQDTTDAFGHLTLI